MKKLIAIIVILVTIFIGMILYKKIAIKTNNDITIQEIESIETYITKIYMWKEITNEAMPTFENINEASDIWIWEAVKKNLEDYELTFEQIEDKAKELFGEALTKEFPKEGNKYLQYDEQTDKYYAEGEGLDKEEDSFLLSKIEKTKEGYQVEIVEYLEDYTNLISNINDNQNNIDREIVIKNLKRRRSSKT